MIICEQQESLKSLGWLPEIRRTPKPTETEDQEAAADPLFCGGVEGLWSVNKNAVIKNE